MLNFIKIVWKAIKTFFSSKWIKWIIIGICSILIISLSIATSYNKKAKNKYKEEVVQKEMIINKLNDSIKYNITPVYNYQIFLKVDDKSIYTTKANYNKGNIYNPSTKTYLIKIDGTNVSIKPISK